LVERHMGGTVRLVFYAAGGAARAGQAARDAFAAVAEVDRMMSDYKPESDLCRVGAAAGGGPVPVPAALVEVLVAAQRVAAASDGAFDPTVGPMVQAWRRARKEGRLTTPEEVAAAKALVGHRLLHLDPAGRTARLERPGMRLDLGGIAKGYACDAALRALAARGITRAMVDGEGDFALGDPPPGRDVWHIAIYDHPELVLRLARCGVATSGDSARYVEVGGRRYSHIVDPATGYGIENLSLATVVAPDGMTADAWATAVSVLGPERAIAVVERQAGLQAWMEWRTPGGPQTARTKGLDGLLRGPTGR
jgi:thiamine biosynthesis lipoprotein